MLCNESRPIAKRSDECKLSQDYVERYQRNELVPIGMVPDVPRWVEMGEGRQTTGVTTEGISLAREPLVYGEGGINDLGEESPGRCSLRRSGQGAAERLRPGIR